MPSFLIPRLLTVLPMVSGCNNVRPLVIKTHQQTIPTILSRSRLYFSALGEQYYFINTLEMKSTSISQILGKGQVSLQLGQHLCPTRTSVP
jgi:hypothetical protein